VPEDQKGGKSKGLGTTCLINTKKSDSILQKKNCISITKINLLTLFREIMAVYSENHMKYI
jgi:hypothetical protein